MNVDITELLNANYECHTFHHLNLLGSTTRRPARVVQVFVPGWNDTFLTISGSGGLKDCTEAGTL